MAQYSADEAEAFKPVFNAVYESPTEETLELLRRCKTDSDLLREVYDAQLELLVQYIKAHGPAEPMAKNFYATLKRLQDIIGFNIGFPYKVVMKKREGKEAKEGKSSEKTVKGLKAAVMFTVVDHLRFSPPETQHTAADPLAVHLFNAQSQSQNLMMHVLANQKSVTIRFPDGCKLYNAQSLPSQERIQQMFEAIEDVDGMLHDVKWSWSDPPRVMAIKLNLVLYVRTIICNESALLCWPALVGCEATQYGHTYNPGWQCYEGTIQHKSKERACHFVRSTRRGLMLGSLYKGVLRTRAMCLNENCTRATSTVIMQNDPSPLATLNVSVKIPFPREAKEKDVSAWAVFTLCGCKTIREMELLLWPNGQTLCGKGRIDPIIVKDTIAMLQYQQREAVKKGQGTREEILKSLPFDQRAKNQQGVAELTEHARQELERKVLKWINSVLAELFSNQGMDPHVVVCGRKEIAVAYMLCRQIEMQRGVLPFDLEDEPAYQRFLTGYYAMANLVRYTMPRDIRKQHLADAMYGIQNGKDSVPPAGTSERRAMTGGVYGVVTTGSASVSSSANTGSTHYVQLRKSVLDSRVTHNNLGGKNLQVSARDIRASSMGMCTQFPDNQDGAGRRPLAMGTDVRPGYKVEMLQAVMDEVIPVNYFSVAPGQSTAMGSGDIQSVVHAHSGPYVVVNDRFMGRLGEGLTKEEAVQRLLQARRHGLLMRDASVLQDGWSVHLLGDEGALAIPTLRVAHLAQFLSIYRECKQKNRMHQLLLRCRMAKLIEMLTMDETYSLAHSIAKDLSMLCRRAYTACAHWGPEIPYHTHILLHPAQQAGFAIGRLPDLSTNQAIRNSFNIQMLQAGAPYAMHMPNWRYSLTQAQDSLMMTPPQRAYGSSFISQHQTFAWLVDNNSVEDSSQMALEALDCVLGVQERQAVTDMQKPDEVRCSPDTMDGVMGMMSADYSQLRKGLVMNGAFVTVNTVLVGKVCKVTDVHPVTGARMTRWIDKSKVQTYTEEVEAVYRVGSVRSGHTAMRGVVVVHIKLSRMRTLAQGSKVSMGPQKFTIGPDRPYHTLPYLAATGEVPAFVLNTLAFKRQTNSVNTTMSKLLLAAILGNNKHCIGDAFHTQEWSVVEEALKKAGVEHGKTKMVDPVTGLFVGDCTGDGSEAIEVFFAPMEAVRAYAHTAAVKAQRRGVDGKRSMLHDQPENRRINDGGMRAGWLTLVIMMTVGCVKLALDTIMKAGMRTFAVCVKCGRYGMNPPDAIMRALFLQRKLERVEEAIFLQKTIESQKCMVCGDITVCIEHQAIIKAINSLLTAANLSMLMYPLITDEQAAEARSKFQMAMDIVYGKTPVPVVAGRS